MLAMPGPANILWGPEHIQLYNDAYIAIARDRHPTLLGRPAAKGWSEIHDELLAPVMEAAFAGRSTRLADLSVRLRGPDGQPENRAFDSTWTPIRDPTGMVGGALEVLVEVTDSRRVQAALRESEARQAFLLSLGDAVRAQTSAKRKIEVAAHRLGKKLDASRILYAEFDEAKGIADVFGGWSADGAHPFPSVMQLANHDGPVMNDLRGGRTVRVDDVAAFIEQPAYAAIAAVGVGALLSVPLLVDGKLSVNLSVHQLDARRWTDDEVALVQEVAERLWAEIVRSRAEAALRESEARYRSLFETMDQGYSLNEVIRDAEGRAIDIRYIEHNPALERLTGVSASEAVGRLASEVFPGLDRFWVDVLDRVVTSGATEQVEHELSPLGRWYQSKLYPVGGDRCVSLYDDITERKTAEAMLRDREERQTFLLKFSDALRGETGADAIANRAIRLVSEHLVLDRCYITFYRPDDDAADFPYQVGNDSVPPLPPSVRLSDFPEAYEQVQDRTFIVNDDFERRGLTEAEQASSKALGMRAMVASTARKGEKLPLKSFVALSSRARRWTHGEVTLVEEAAERTWAAMEGARTEAALRESEERFRSFGEASENVLWIVDAATRQLEYVSPAFERIWGEPRETIMADLGEWAQRVHPDDLPPPGEGLEALLGGRSYTAEYRVQRRDGATRYIRDTGFPIFDGHGQVRRIAGVAQDLTDRRLAEHAVIESERRARTLMEGIPQLVWRSGDEGRWTWSSPQWQDCTGQSLEESLGLGWLNAIHPDDRDAAMQAWEKAAQRGGLDVEYRVRRASDGAYLWHHTRSTPVVDEGGRIVEWLGTTTDVQQLRELHERQEVMVAELQHRTRNLIAVVRSIAQQTMMETGPTEAFRDEFNHRLEALARVQGLLSRSDEEPITIAALIAMELDALGARLEPGRIVVDGPAVPIRHSVVQTLALALHELATNSRKYGALSDSRGRLDIRWRTYSDAKSQRLALEWTEVGGQLPKPESEARRGYGRELIEQALPYSLNAKTSYRHDETGLRCTIDMPLERNRSRRSAA